MAPSMQDIFAENLDKLMKHHDLSHDFLGKKTGLGQTTISNLLTPGRVKSVRTVTMDKVAAYFGLAPYHMLIPNQSIEDLLSKKLEKVVECYTATENNQGKDNILRVSENEVRYCVVQKQVNSRDPG